MCWCINLKTSKMTLLILNVPVKGAIRAANYCKIWLLMKKAD